MAIIFEREIRKLKKQLLGLGARVEEGLRDAVNALARHDLALARRVVDSDVQIDHTEVEVEEECLKILALHQPVAIDLRFVVSCLKINSDLERVGDLAANIAERVLALGEEQTLAPPMDFRTMADKAQSMLKNSLDALIGLDATLARKVCAMDDEVDLLCQETHDQVEQRITRRPQEANGLIQYLCVARHLERVGDHATNIAEDVVYMLEGDIARHGSGPPPAPKPKNSGARPSP